MVNVKNTVSKLLDTVFSDGIASLFYLFMALPLVYIPGHHIYSRSLRLSCILFVTLATFLVPSLWSVLRSNLLALGRWVKVFLTVSLVLVVISSLTSSAKTSTMLFGVEPNYMGALAWLCIIPFSLLFSGRLKSLLFSKVTVLLMSAVLLVSLLMGWRAIIGGYRIPGLMMQATTMAMYAVLAFVVSLDLLTQKHKEAWAEKLAFAGLLLAVLTVIATQSRVGYVGLVMVCTYFGIRLVSRKSPFVFILLGICVLLPLVSVIYKDRFTRLNATSVHRGIEYRGNIYETTGREVLRKNIIIGDGPSVLPEDLNNTSMVPEDIAKTLNEGLVFISSHDLFLDLALFFGVIVAFGFLILFGYTLLHGLKDPATMELRLAFVVLIINALCNTISPEILTLTFMVLLALLIPQHNKTTAHESTT